MQIHLSDISSSEGKSQHYSVAFEMDTITFQQGTFPVLAKEPVELTITNTGDRVLELEGSGLVTVGIPCDRCLEEVRTRIPFEFKRKLDMKLTDEERVNDLDESSYLTGYDLDVDRLVYLEVLMSWPLKVLCKEDCKGICSRCGKNLNDGPCGCAEEPKDPNWKMSAPNLVKCSKCGALMMPHRVCKACGSYNKKEIVKVED